MLNGGNQGHIDATDPDGRLQLESGKHVDTHKFEERDWSCLAERGVRWVGIASLARFANHSTHPNARMSGDKFKAVKNIALDEEITINYGPKFMWS